MLNKNNKLYIRVDANSQIGSGHVMRCLSIACEGRKQGIDTTFIIADKTPEQLLMKYGFSFICLDTEWNQLDREIECLQKLTSELNIQKLIVDSYYITLEYLKQLAMITELIYIDDVNQFVYPVDILINYNIYAHKLNYDRYSEKERFLLGCKFAPLREEFINNRMVVRNQVKNILITTGGSDQYNFSGHLVEYLQKFSYLKDIQLHLVLGRYNIHKDTIEEQAKQYQNVVLHYNVDKMSKLMLECDIAVSAGGSTLYELCACGVPTISFSFADNQLEGVKEFHNQRIIDYAGDIRNDEKQCLDKIRKRMTEYIYSTTARVNISNQMMIVVDGLGSKRIIKQIYIHEMEE